MNPTAHRTRAVATVRITTCLVSVLGYILVTQGYSVAAGDPAGMQSAENPAAGLGYEQPPTLRAADLLPDYLLSGALFIVEAEVRNDGETNHYVIRSPLGDVEASGRDGLKRAIQELRALALLKESSKRTGAVVGFNQGMKRAIAAPYKRVKRVVFNPLYAIEAIPHEFASWVSKAATAADVIQYGPRVYIRRTLGIDSARENLARRLHVDEDTENEALREELKRVGWGVWSGGLVPGIGEKYLAREFKLSTEVGHFGHANLGRSVNALRREVFPTSARRILRKMDVSKDLVKAFRDHPHFSSRMREHVALALRTMKETRDRSAYIAWAITLDGEEEARRAVGLVEVMAVHHATEEHVTRILNDGDILLFDTAGESAVYPLVYDYLIWSEAAASDFMRAAEMKSNVAPDKALAVWSMGEVSPRMHAELTERGCCVRTKVDEQYAAFERPRKGLKRVEQRYEKNTEDPIQAKISERLGRQRTQRLVLEPLGPGRN